MGQTLIFLKNIFLFLHFYILFYMLMTQYIYLAKLRGRTFSL